MSIIIISTILVLIVVTIWLRTSNTNAKHASDKSSRKLPPIPSSSLPIIGSIFQIYFNKPTFRWITETLKEMNTHIACIPVGNVHIIPVHCPKIAREFLKKHDEIFASRPITMASDYASCGFLTISFSPFGDQWKKMKKMVASHLTNASTLRWLHDKRVEEADNLIIYILNQWRKSSTANICCSSDREDHNEGGMVDIRVATRHYCGNLIRNMMFNRRYFGEGGVDGGPGFEEEEYMEAIFTVLFLVYSFAVSDYFPFLRIFDLDGHEKAIKQAYTVIHKYHDAIIEERVRQRESSYGKENPNDLLDVLISIKGTDGNPLLSTQEIRAQIAELMYASIDNPSNAVEWIIAEMFNQPEILKKAVEEIDMVVGKDRLVQESDVSQLNYLKACAREAMRLHPFAPYNVPHLSLADMTIAGYFIPKGSHVLLSRVGLGRNPDVWDEPLKFRPERHLGIDDGSEVDLTEPGLRYISFSTGRRGCIGIALGSTMTIMLLARMLQGFEWSATYDQGEQKIDLSEAPQSLLLSKPLCGRAKPRLPMHLYPSSI